MKLNSLLLNYGAAALIILLLIISAIKTPLTNSSLDPINTSLKR